MKIRIEDVEAAGELLGGIAGGAVDGALVGVADAALSRLIGELENVGRFVDTLRISVAAEVEERSRPELGRAGMAQRAGHTKAAHLIEQVTRVSQGEAVRRVRLGAMIRPGSGLDGQVMPARYPLVAEAMGAGVLGLDAASRITRCLNQALRTATLESVEAAEEALVDAARDECADLVGVHAAVWREALDPDGALPRDEQLRARRSFVLGRERDGMTPIWGLADPAAGALLRAMFSEGANPAVKPRFLSEEDLTAGTEVTLSAECEWVETVRDPRTTEQRQFDILLGTLTAGCAQARRVGQGCAR